MACPQLYQPLVAVNRRVARRGGAAAADIDAAAGDHVVALGGSAREGRAGAMAVRCFGEGVENAGVPTSVTVTARC